MTPENLYFLHIVISKRWYSIGPMNSMRLSLELFLNGMAYVFFFYKKLFLNALISSMIFFCSNLFFSLWDKPRLRNMVLHLSNIPTVYSCFSKSIAFMELILEFESSKKNTVEPCLVMCFSTVFIYVILKVSL